MTAMRLIREKGYASTRVEDVCSAANITKGAFFHHFKSKEAMAEAAAHFWSEFTGSFFAQAPYQSLPNPVDRLFGYLEFREAILQGAPAEFTCLAGTMVQETYLTHPGVREACQQSIWDHAATIEPWIQAALDTLPPGHDLDAHELALFSQAVLQGGFILAKAKSDAGPAISAARHLRHYFGLLFRRQEVTETIGEKR